MKYIMFNHPFQIIPTYKADGGSIGGGRPIDILRSNRGQGGYSSRPPPKKPINLGNDIVVEEEDFIRFLNDLKEKDPAGYSAVINYLKIHHPEIKVTESWG
jgi:hypothetical protein